MDPMGNKPLVIKATCEPRQMSIKSLYITNQKLAMFGIVVKKCYIIRYMEVSINGDTQKLVVYKENPSING
jgi:hypothetical protein